MSAKKLDFMRKLQSEEGVGGFRLAGIKVVGLFHPEGLETIVMGEFGVVDAEQVLKILEKGIELVKKQILGDPDVQVLNGTPEDNARRFQEMVMGEVKEEDKETITLGDLLQQGVQMRVREDKRGD